MNISYDLHIHSCLSPCGDNDMTPNNILNMSTMLGLDCIAVSDHNSALNLPAIFKIAAEMNIIVIPAIEVCTDEEVHMLCYFKTLESVLAFGEELYTHLPMIKNNVDIFGKQLILDYEDNIIGHEEKLLINAVDIGIDKLIKLADKYDGITIPAHVDKSANSIIASLGYIPPDYNFTCVEVKNPDKKVEFDGKIITNSDAHYLEDISEPIRTISIKEKSITGVLNYLTERN